MTDGVTNAGGGGDDIRLVDLGRFDLGDPVGSLSDLLSANWMEGRRPTSFGTANFRYGVLGRESSLEVEVEDTVRFLFA